MDTLRPAILLLEDGTLIHGRSIGAKGTTTGEICFNTGMTGYQEIYTDPSYFGQIIINTTAHIGNYGVHGLEQESGSAKFAGLVCDRFSDTYSRQQASGSLQAWLELNHIPGIADIDTRALVRKVRTSGAQNALISTEIADIDNLKALLAQAPNMAELELSSRVTTKSSYSFGSESLPHTVAVLDLGVKKSILEGLNAVGLRALVFPAQTTFAELAQTNPDGYFLSNGPGDPAAMDYAVETAGLMQQSGKPVFGICLGHQILARANGADTFKMHHGHRGLNHPVRNLITGLCEITTQNHGFGVDPEAVKKSNNTEITHVNLNDQSIEGIRLTDTPAFSVQYHPEATPGPHDSRYLFDDFVLLIKAQNDI
jgi:carbamoyl-phosphate synthase small subunit